MQIQRSRLKIEREKPKYWSLHTHSRYSYNDALPTVEAIVERVAEFGQQGIALTDHGNMAGSVELYLECMKRGIKPFPGSEMYFVPDLAQYKADYKNRNVKAERFHMGVMAYTSKGYENMVALSTASHKNFFHKPTVDFAMLADFADDGRTEGLAVTTGCYYGYAVQGLIKHGEDYVKNFLQVLDTWFPGNVYVEGQNHFIDHGDGWNDDLVADAMMSIAEDMGLPYVITQDSHYVDLADKEAHESLKQLVAFGPDPDDAVFPGDGFALADDRWMRGHHRPDRFERGCEGLADLLGKHQLGIAVLDSYSYSVPAVVVAPQEEMEGRCLQQLQEMSLPQKYSAQLAEEFDVINAAGMAGYMMLVAQVTDWMRERGIVFQTRGSAAGSLVCWLLGISSVDPLKWDLRFERFLSRDRTKPPDVDLDIQHDRRHEVVEWLDTRFTAHQIGSWAKYGLDPEEEGEDTKGSLLVRYWSARNKVEVSEEEAAEKEIPPEHMAMLRDLSDRKLYKGMGTNAAGVVITSNPAEFDRLVPLARMERAGDASGYVTQYSKDFVEALGLVKLDVLGSKTLTVLSKTMMNLDLPISALEDIEFNDGPSYQLIRSGSTEGIFQMEGAATKWGCKDLKPNHIKDVIAAMALFRPAAMNTGGTKAYIERKHKRKDVPTRHELLQKVTAPTYGVLLYQEQVIDMLRGLGMGADDLTKFLKAVKASNKDIGAAGVVIKGYQEWIGHRCEEMGFTDEDMRYLDEAIAGFAEYGFNRAHATVYGITAYRCAYLATHHSVEFHGGLLAVAAGTKKEQKYLQVTRRRGVSVRQPHVNVSGSSYTVDREYGVIRKGLQSIHGIGEKAATCLAGLAPYTDLADLVERSPGRPVSGGKAYDGTLESLNGVMGHLRDAGALAGLE